MLISIMVVSVLSMYSFSFFFPKKIGVSSFYMLWMLILQLSTNHLMLLLLKMLGICSGLSVSGYGYSASFILEKNENSFQFFLKE